LSNKWLVQVHKAFISIDSAREWINRCGDIDEIKQVRRAAQAYERDIVEAGTLKIYAERRLGQILSEVIAHEGGRPAEETVTTCDRFSLKDIGLTKNESSAFQTLAAMQEEELQEGIARYRQINRSPSARGIAQSWKRSQYVEQKRKKKRALPINVKNFTFRDGDGEEMILGRLKQFWMKGSPDTRAEFAL